MATNQLKHDLVYKGDCIILTTKHAKSIAIAPAFYKNLGASILEYVADTDEFGTFSGEIERKGNALECARKKAEGPLKKLNKRIKFMLASEGSFGPHPLMPLLPCDREILYFIDRKRGFHLHSSHLSESTNYSMKALDSLEELQEFAATSLFPSHALILRPKNRDSKDPVFKGVNSHVDLEEAFKECQKHEFNGKVWVETDMRAQFNPTRMTVIGELAEKLSKRLNTPCPSCYNPGWGNIGIEKGLPCSYCGLETEMTKHEIFGCVKCEYKQISKPREQQQLADPLYCSFCNP
ncbi:MAG: DUF6671 family protein [Pseudomonadota bacterium]|jgi:hypothetical protein|nr:hypothetical protein [Alphaproteobacteria bacterium]